LEKEEKEEVEETEEEEEMKEENQEAASNYAIQGVWLKHRTNIHVYSNKQVLTLSVIL